MCPLTRSGATCVIDMQPTLGIGREPHEIASHSSESGRSRSTRVVLALAVVLLFAGLAFAAVPAHAAPVVIPDGTITSIRIVRTAADLASVLGTTVSVSEPIDVLVDGVVARSGTTVFTGDYWFLDVPVKDGSLVQTRMSGGP